jgi:hypothetical protein
MRLRALITIDIDADDYVDAADHQRRLQTLVEAIQADYPQASLQLRERRARRGRRNEGSGDTVTQLKHYTGRLNRYV